MVKKSYLLRASHCNAVLAKRCRGGDINARQRGSVSLMFVFAMLVIIGVFSLALELPQIYNRKVEMQNLADAVALSAARELDGTAAGISNAINEAKNTAEMFSYAYNTKDVRSIWSASALTFGVSRSSDNWKSEGAAKGAPEGLFFVKVDTRDLSAAPGVVGSFVFAPASNIFDVPGRALAGRSTINAMPLAICAMAIAPGVSRAGELVEYGFRRGVSYDLMQLNPGGTTALNFLINPVAVPGAAGSSAGTATDIVAPFVCTGSMAMPRVKGGAITVQKDFPLDQYFSQINSRFDTLVSPCSAVTAPPDANVKSYVFNNGDRRRKTVDGRRRFTGHWHRWDVRAALGLCHGGQVRFLYARFARTGQRLHAFYHGRLERSV
jgi:Flp pilus assembly protein TadG